MGFVEFKKRKYYRGRYITTGLLVNTDDISIVAECTDDHSCTNIVTKDRSIHTLNEPYSDVVNKIANAERKDDGGGT